MTYCTVREIAEKTGVTPQGINKYLRTSGMREQCKKDGNRFLIPGNIQKQLETHFLGKQVKSETKTETVDNKETESETVSVPWEVYEDLRRQLKIKDEQIRDLSKALLSAQDQGQAAQLLHAADRKNDLLFEDQEQKAERKSRLQRLKEAWRG